MSTLDDSFLGDTRWCIDAFSRQELRKALRCEQLLQEGEFTAKTTYTFGKQRICYYDNEKRELQLDNKHSFSEVYAWNIVWGQNPDDSKHKSVTATIYIRHKPLHYASLDE